MELERQRQSKQACLETPRVVWPTPGSLFGPRKPIKSVTRGLQTVARRSGSHGVCVQYVCENTGVPQKRPTARDVQASPSLRRDLLSFGSAFGEPVTAPHVVHTWLLGWAVGSIGGDALTDSHAAGRHVTTHWDCSVGRRRHFSKWAHHAQAGLTHEAAENSKDFSRAFSGPPHRGARPIDPFRCSARDARARRHTSSIDDQSAAPGVSPTSADSPVRAGQRPVDLVRRAISNRWQVHCEIIGNRSIF